MTHLIIIDTEFTDFSQPQLISIGAVIFKPTADALRSDFNHPQQLEHYYAQCIDFDTLKTSAFVRAHVLPLLSASSMPTSYALEYFLRFCSALDQPFVLAADSQWDEKVLLQSLHQQQMKMPKNYQGFVLLQQLFNERTYDRWEHLRRAQTPDLVKNQAQLRSRLERNILLLDQYAQEYLKHQHLLPHHALHDAQSLCFSFNRLMQRMDSLLHDPD